MYKIPTNVTGSREMYITDAHLETIEKRSLFQHLLDSTGFINEDVLDKLKMMVRSMMEQEKDCYDLINLSHEVLFNHNMKAHGLGQLIRLYRNWIKTKKDLKQENIE